MWNEGNKTDERSGGTKEREADHKGLLTIETN